ncbi:hypothetical protein WNY37_05595 [Henriciella sp. AS95]|uniref:hypothetical protein n=1 Tax=Henriciella sp. AS95 TaxID=3135782 RepID=UPI00317B60EF
MARRSSRSRRAQSKGSNLHKFVVGGAAIIAVLVLFGSAFLRANAPTLDEETLCSGAAPPRVTLILVDATDSLNAVQRASISNQIDRLVGSLLEGERVELFAVSDKADLLTPLFEKCRPGDGSNANVAISNPEKIKENYQSAFVAPLQKAFNDLIVDESSNHTPLMRAIQAASVKGFGRWPDTTDRRLIVVSDMLEYDAERSHYSPAGIEETDFDTPSYSRLKTDLKGGQVELWYIRRTTRSDVQGAKHIEFWQSYFAHLNGLVSRVFPVEG